MHSRAIYKASKQSILRKFLNNAHHGYFPIFHVAHGMNSICKHMGKLQRAITIILRCESKKSVIKFCISIHSACPYKNYLPKCSQTFYCRNLFFKLARTQSRKKLPRNPHNTPRMHSGAIYKANNLGCTEPYKAILQF